MTDAADTATLARQWEYPEIVALGAETDPETPECAPDQQRVRALARLRDKIRDAGYVIVPESLTETEATPVVVDEAGWRVAGEGDVPNATRHTWAASATQRPSDIGDLLPTESDDDGRLWFKVPEPVTADGGDLRLRHGLNVAMDRVTAHVYRHIEDAPGSWSTEEMGLLLAVGVDENVLSVELLPGAGSVSVEADPDPTEDTDGRLLWMLRFLADEFGTLGVLATARKMWPDAFKVAAADSVAERTDEPPPGGETPLA